MNAISCGVARGYNLRHLKYSGQGSQTLCCPFCTHFIAQKLLEPDNQTPHYLSAKVYHVHSTMKENIQRKLPHRYPLFPHSQFPFLNNHHRLTPFLYKTETDPHTKASPYPAPPSSNSTASTRKNGRTYPTPSTEKKSNPTAKAGQSWAAVFAGKISW